MPKLMSLNGWNYSFYSNEGIPPEPPHIHISKAESDVKIWLDSLEIAYSYKVNNSDLKKILDVVEQNKELFKRKYLEFHNGN